MNWSHLVDPVGRVHTQFLPLLEVCLRIASGRNWLAGYVVEEAPAQGSKHQHALSGHVGHGHLVHGAQPCAIHDIIICHAARILTCAAA